MSTSPLAGENGVAISREVRLHFATPLDPARLTSEAVSARTSEGVPLPVRLQLRRDGLELMCFFQGEGLPSAKTIEIELDGQHIRALDGRALDADGDGQPGGRYVLQFTTLDLTRVPGTDLCGRVLASEPGTGSLEHPLTGVTVSVDGLEGEVSTTTDALGNFCLQDTPAGRIFVHINGGTSSAEPGFYYPNVGKTWDAHAGQPTTVGTIYLPAVAEAALIETSATASTEVRMVPEQLALVTDLDLRAALAEVRLVVPPGNLFNDDGSPGSGVGLAPVDPERLPGPLPPGLDFPLVVTVQTDGAPNFDLPVPIELPNLPDPITGLSLAPGEKTALWSFDHDLGKFLVQGSMTVSGDGERLVSDPGVGLRAPGWHAAGDGHLLSALKIWDCSSGSCVQRTDCMLLRNFLDVGKDVYSCLGPLSVPKRIVTCGWSILNASVSAQASYSTFEQSWSDRSKTAPVRQWLNSSVSMTSLLRTSYECLTKDFSQAANQNPMTCVSATVGSLGLFCQAGGLGSNTVPGCPNNQGNAPAWIERICDNNEILSDAVSINSVFADFLTNPPNLGQLGGRIDVILGAYDVISTLVSSAENSSRDLTSSEIAQIESSLSPLAQALAENENALDGVDIALQETNQALDSLEQMLDEVERRIDQLGPTSEQVLVPFYFRAETQRNSLGNQPALSDPLVLRGQTTAEGQVELNVHANSGYRLDLYDPINGLFAISMGSTGPQGGGSEASPAILIDGSDLLDTDGDGLPDDAEPIFGTDPLLADSDGDGESDLDEVLAGTDPTGGALAGVLWEVPTAGEALDLDVDAGLAAVITGEQKLEIFNVFGGSEPARIALHDLPALPEDVATAAGRTLVTLGTAGAGVVDSGAGGDFELAQLSDSFTRSTFCTAGGNPLRIRAAAARGELGFFGAERSLGIVDLKTAEVIGARELPGQIMAIAVSGLHAYVLNGDVVATVELQSGNYEVESLINVRRHGTPVLELFAETDRLFVVHLSGFDRYSLTDPGLPTLESEGQTNRFGWKNIVTDGGALGLAAVGNNSSLNSGRHDVGRYDLAEAGNVWLGDVETEGTVRSVRLESGLVFAADGDAGLVVLQPMAADMAAVAPTVTLESSYDLSQQLPSQEPILLRARAEVDGLLRQVSFYIDGELVAVDGSYPFEYVIPALDGGVAGRQFELRVRAVDTAGLSGEDLRTVAVESDLSGPVLVASLPIHDGYLHPAALSELELEFDETLDALALASGSLSLAEAGPDSIHGTADDVIEALGLPWLDASGKKLSVAVGSSLDEGSYRVLVQPGSLVDGNGNSVEPFDLGFQTGVGLRVRLFAERDCGSRRTFFAGRTPVEFERYDPDSGPTVQLETVVPNIHFPSAPTPWLRSQGADGLFGGGGLTAPAGDDFSLHGMTGNEWGVLFEGSILISSSGVVDFSALIDNAVTLEVGGVMVINAQTGQSVQYPPDGLVLDLEEGFHTFRLALADWGGQVALELYAAGGGFGGGVVPASAFGY